MKSSQRQHPILYYQDSLLVLHRMADLRGEEAEMKSLAVAILQRPRAKCEQTFKFGTDFASTPDASSRTAHMHVEKNLHLQGDALSIGQCNLSFEGR